MSANQPLRRSRRGRKQAYGPGDKVEILRDEGIAIGRLIRKVDHDDEEEEKVLHWIVSFEGEAEEEEVTEKYIGRLVSSSETDSVKSNNSPPPPSVKVGKSVNKNNAKVKKSIRALPRSESLRVRPSTRSTVKHKNFDKKLLKGIKNSKKVTKSSKKSTDKNETVVKVKMLTGTLYLYRGDRPRAEFIRTV